MKKLLVALFVLVLLGSLAAGGLLLWAENGAKSRVVDAADAPVVEFTVPKGTSARALGPMLKERGLITDPLFWRWHLSRRGGLNPKAGRHPLKASMTLAEVATALEQPPLPDDVPFVMIEGWRLRDTDEALVGKGLIKPGEYIAAASKPAQYTAPFPLPTTTLEGYLYPETYAIVPDQFDVKKLVQRQLDTFVERFYAPHKDAIAKSGRSLHDIVVMASMLEREEPTPDQRVVVSGVLWKRIDKGFPLGVDATSRYELAEWNDRTAFLKKLRDPADPYNTRTKTGLPPSPIGAPTVASLLAAMSPEQNEYWYYLHDANKVLHPSRNAAEHEALRAKYGVY
jgi:UPF0755 protein